MAQDTTASNRKWPRQLERLEAAVIDAKKRLGRLSENGKDVSRIRICRELIEEAEQAAEAHRGWFARPRDYLAWDCLAQFDRHMVYLLDASERAVLWESLKAEAEEKLSGHRKKAIQELSQKRPAALDLEALWASVRADAGEKLDTPCEEAVQRLITKAKDWAPPADLVSEVMRQLQTTSGNMYHKIGQLQRQIDYATWFLVFLVAVLLSGAAIRIHLGMSTNLDGALLLGTLLGLTGGVLSLAFTVTRSDPSAKIPATLTSFKVARIRPFIGAAIALPVILIFESGVISIAGADKDVVTTVACFLAGFSERWFLGLIEKVEKKAGDGR